MTLFGNSMVKLWELWLGLDQNYSSITCFYDQMAGISLNKLKTVQEIQTSRNLDAGIEHKVI